MSEKIAYEGEVVLLCQEGGYAHPAIECADAEGGEPMDVTGKLHAMFGDSRGRTLDQLLVDAFGEGERRSPGDRSGDRLLGRLRISVERVE